jgi:PTS system mannose-specific IIA component
MLLKKNKKIGTELLEALNQIVGSQLQAKAISIGIHDDIEECRNAILTAIKDVNAGQGVVLLTDMFGGTPSNLAIAAMPRSHAVVLAGVNLPMLIKLASVRGTLPLLDAVREAEMAARKYIQLVSETIAPSSAA